MIYVILLHPLSLVQMAVCVCDSNGCHRNDLTTSTSQMYCYAKNQIIGKSNNKEEEYKRRSWFLWVLSLSDSRSGRSWYWYLTVVLHVELSLTIFNVAKVSLRENEKEQNKDVKTHAICLCVCVCIFLYLLSVKYKWKLI